MMNRNIAIGLGALVIILLGAAVIVLPALMNQSTPGMTVTLYDADGKKVYEVGAPTGAFFEFGFVNEDGSIVVTAVINIDYEVSVTGELGDVTVSGELVVESFPADMPELPPIITKTYTLGANSLLIGSYEETVTLIDLINVLAYTIPMSYKYVFTATLTATTDGATSEPWTDSCTLLIDWVPDGLSIVGSIYLV